MQRRLRLVSESRREELRTNLWLVPTLLVIVAVGLFAVTHAVDQAAYAGRLALPSWANSGNANAARQILTSILAAVITVSASCSRLSWWR